jgi:hypothetical protein
MEKLISIIKDKHFAYFKDGEDIIPCVCEYEAVFQDKDGNYVHGSFPNLKYLCESTAEEHVTNILEGEGQIRKNIVDKEDIVKMSSGIVIISGTSDVEGFGDVLKLIAEAKPHLEDDAKEFLAQVRDSINEILK